jgi:peptide/nickel transport system substrate-binding protein
MSTYWQQIGTKRIGRRRALTAGAGGLGAAVLAACGGSEKKETPGSGALSGGAQATAAVPAAQLPAAGAGGTLRIHENGDPASLDFIKTWSARTMLFTSMVYPRLLNYDTSPGVGPIDFKVKPDLAQAIPEQPDQMTYIFKLKPAKWENKTPLNGRALTAQDVAKNWDRFAADNPNRSLLTDVTKVEAVSDDTVKFTLAKPLGSFINNMGHQGYFYVQPPELFSGGQLEKDMWSAGPFIFKGYEVGSRLKFERNPNYFVKDRPLLKEVIWELIPDPSTTMSALRSKQLDSTGWTAVIAPGDVDQMKKDIPDAVTVEYGGQGNSWVGMDLADPKFQDKRVRQAISMSLNRDDLGKVGGKGIWTLPWGILPQFYFDPKKNEFPNAKYYQHNVAEAKKLLEAAGVKDFPTYDMISSAVWSPTQVQSAQLLQQQLKAIGLNTTIKQLEFAQFYAQTVIGGKWSGGLTVGANLVGTDPNDYLAILWTPDSPRLIAPGLKDILAKDTELLNLMEAQRRELDVQKRKAILKDVVDVMADRMYNIPSVTGIYYHLHRGNVKNMNWIWSYSPGGEYLADTFVQG